MRPATPTVWSAVSWPRCSVSEPSLKLVVRLATTPLIRPLPIGRATGPSLLNACPKPKTRSPSTSVQVPIAVSSESPVSSGTARTEPGSSFGRRLLGDAGPARAGLQRHEAAGAERRCRAVRAASATGPPPSAASRAAAAGGRRPNRRTRCRGAASPSADVHRPPGPVPLGLRLRPGPGRVGSGAARDRLVLGRLPAFGRAAAPSPAVGEVVGRPARSLAADDSAGKVSMYSIGCTPAIGSFVSGQP